MVNHLTTLCKSQNIKLYTFADNFALSGGYWMLCAGDEVYSYKSSLVGSIGALITLIDVKEFIDKRGIERQFISSHENEK